MESLLELLYEDTDQIVDGWHSYARKLLDGLRTLLRPGEGGDGWICGGVEYVAVTMGELVPTLVKLLLYRLDVSWPVPVKHGNLSHVESAGISI
eukprot:scaffold206750_cov41-Prasinocladus_malaysianus.AAC.1